MNQKKHSVLDSGLRRNDEKAGLDYVLHHAASWREIDLAACWSAKADRLLTVEFGEKRGQIGKSIILFCNSTDPGFALGVCRG